MRVIWLPTARKQRDAAIEYIRADNPRAALAQARQIKQQLRQIGDNPYIGKPGPIGDTREKVIAGTPFVVYYAIQNNTVRILRLLHSAQQRP